MSEKETYSFRYFNGKNAIPETGVANVGTTSLVLNIQNQEIKFPFDSFHQAEIIHNGIRLTLHNDEHKESPTVELVCSPHQAKEISRLWSSHKKGENLFQSISLFFHNLSSMTILSLGLIFILSSGTLFYLALQKIYTFVPNEIDNHLGKNFDENIQKSFSICTSQETDRFFSLAIKQLVPKNSRFKYSVRVINLNEENAISLAGGRIYFFSGLLNASSNQEEILGVLAHEISHVEKRHHLRSMIKALGTSFAISMLVGPGLGDFQTLETLTEIGSTIAVLKYSRDFETEADQYAYELLAKSNRDVSGLLQFLKRMHSYENGSAKKKQTDAKRISKEKMELSEKINNSIVDLLSSHPPTEERITAAEKVLKTKPLPKLSKSLVSEKEWARIRSACKAKDIK